MGRHKPQHRSRFDTSQIGDVNIPIQELSVHKRVPAVIHWATVDGNDREDDETIGEAIIYENGTSDVIVFDDISEDAKHLVGVINTMMDNFSLED